MTAGSTLFAGLAILPKKSALTDYSYRLTHDHQRRFLAALDTTMIGSGLGPAPRRPSSTSTSTRSCTGVRIPPWKSTTCPPRSQRSRSVLTFFAQDCGTHNLVYANADLDKATQSREVLAFCDHWKDATGTDPTMLVIDQKVTNQQVLGELDARGVTFLTLRMRSPSLTRQIGESARLRLQDHHLGPHRSVQPAQSPRVHRRETVQLPTTASASSSSPVSAGTPPP